MTATVETRRRSFVGFLADELAFREGRPTAVARMAIGCAMTVAVAMTFKIPLPPYMAYVVLLVNQDDKAATLTYAVGASLAVTLAVLFSLVCFLIDAGEPALRLPIMAVTTFLAMYSSRTFALGPISFLAGFVLVTLQSTVDDVPNGEVLTRLTLWLWVVALVPVCLSIVINLIAGQSAVLLIRRTVSETLQHLERTLRQGASHDELAGWRAKVLHLLPSQQRIEREAAASPRVTREFLETLLELLLMMEVLPADLTAADREDLLHRLAAVKTVLRAGVERTTATVDATAMKNPVQAAVAEALGKLARSVGAPPKTAPAKQRPALLVADAFTNPAHVRFALKTTLAVMLVYGIYTMLAWPGLRTSIVTCFFVALGSLGETVRKLVLRLSGAMIGGLLAALSIVFLLPRMTDIGQLCLLIGVLAAGAAWVATSSERLSYAGLQIAFAFFVGVLQGYTPATDLTVLRDRVVGVLLGNIAITIVFTLLWPESARQKLGAAFGVVLRGVSKALRRDPEGGAPERLAVINALSSADNLALLCAFESHLVPPAGHRAAAQVQATAVARLAGAALAASGPRWARLGDPDEVTRQQAWLNAAADCAARGEPLPTPAETTPRADPAGDDPAGDDEAARAARRSDLVLRSEMARAVSAFR